MPRSNLIPNEKYYWSPTITNKAAPTVAELTTSGKLLSPAIPRGGVEGFRVTAGTEDAADIDTKYPIVVGGMYEIADMSITLFENTTAGSTEEVILALFSLDAIGFVVISRNGLAVAAKKVEVWPVTVISKSPANRAVNEPAKTMVSLAFRDVPELNATVAA